MITFGSKATDHGNAYRTRLRAFAVDRSHPGALQLVQQPGGAPRSFPLAGAKFGELSPNQRWGTSAFVEADERLCLYFTARNPRPSDEPGFPHDLEIAEVSWNG